MKKTSDWESHSSVFEAYSLGFRFLSQVYLETPQEIFIEDIEEKHLFFEWPIAENQEAITEGLRILRLFFASSSSFDLPSLQQDYLNLFIGLEKVLAPPYASVYSSEDRLLFEQPVVNVKRFYKKMDVHIGPPFSEPDDHVGFELYCLSFLCSNASQAAKKNNLRSYEEALDLTR